MIVEAIGIAAAAVTIAGGFWGAARWFLNSRAPHLSQAAHKLLQEIKLCDNSASKGLSIMPFRGISAAYVPYLWSQAQHGKTSLLVREDASEIFAAADELLAAGCLVKIHQSAGLIQFRLKS